MPPPTGGRAHVDYGEEHRTAIGRYVRLKELGFPPAAIRGLLQARKGIPFPVADGITLIAALVNQARDDAGAHPATLVAMDIGITLPGGLAVVETKRTFRNDEATAIKALLSLPVPVHAAFFGLTAKIAGGILKGIAQAREEARETVAVHLNPRKKLSSFFGPLLFTRPP